MASSGWTEHTSRKTGLKYWFNPRTGESRYEDPTAPVPPPAPLPAPEPTPRPSEAPEAWYSTNAATGDRWSSKLLHLRSLNNWIKATLIREYAPRPCSSVLELACGRLGDINKWQLAGVSRYCGVDIARGALVEGLSRFNKIAQATRMTGKLAQADLGSVDLGASGFLGPSERFDCVSIQFALHYFFRSETTALTFFNNIASRLNPGGVFLGTLPDANVLIRRLRNAMSAVPPSSTFGNTVYSVAFEAESAKAQWSLGSRPYGCGYRFYLGAGEGDVSVRAGGLLRSVCFPCYCF
jgi:mRNA (guanine-N7-)-methyltransferase